MQMIAVVRGITRNDKPDGRNVKAGCARGVGESEWHTDEIVAFQVNDVSSQRFRDRKLTRNLAGKARVPKRLERLWRCLLSHDLDDFRPRHETGTWKSLQNGAGAKEMIAVAMGGIDRRQILSARDNPLRQGARLLDGNRSVDQDRVARPGNQR